MLVATKVLCSIFLFTLLTAQLAALSFNTNECDKTKGCFFFPDGCDSSESCDFLVTYNTNSSTVEFELSGKGAWAAVGFSEDEQMPKTDIIMCVDPDEQPRSGHYYASGRSIPEFDNTSAVTIRDVILEGGIVKCRVLREISPSGSDEKLRDLKEAWFILGAYGSVAGDEPDRHKRSDRKSSGAKILVSEATTSTASEIDLVLVHGILMTLAWIGFATVGLFTARYMRAVWEPTKIAGKKAWFTVHRTIMSITVLMTIAGIVVIFVKVKGWSSSAGAHPYFGIIVLVLALVQPIMAAFRPHPGAPRRNIFNWVHRLVGSLALILAVVSIYLGLNLWDVEKGLYPVITFYVGEFIIFLFEVYLILSQRRKAATAVSTNNTQDIPMEQPGTGQRPPTPEPDMPIKEQMIRTIFFVFAVLLGSSVSCAIILLMILK